jgi:integrase
MGVHNVNEYGLVQKCTVKHFNTGLLGVYVMNTYPFTVFKRSNRPYYFVSFKDANGNFLSPVSTKKTDEKEAMKVAFLWLRDGIPNKSAITNVHELSLKDVAKKIKTEAEAETLLAEMKRLGWVKSYVLKETPQAVDFIAYLKNFWDWENSPYISERLREADGIHMVHCRKQGQAITLYWEPFFNGRLLGEITATDIDAFITYMGTKKVSPSRRNIVIKAGFKALRWAFSKGKITIDPTRGHLLFTAPKKKRNLLNPTTVAALFRADWKDERAKIANMLACVTGMRSGEVLALRAQDLGPDCLYVDGSWNGTDKRKTPKNNEIRTVYIPFPDLMNGLIELAKLNPWGVTPDSFVFWTPYKKNIPMRPGLFVDGLRGALKKIGFSEDDTKKYDYHRWRHFYTAYMKGKMDRKLLKSQTGHLTDAMLDYYGDHETEGDKETILTTSRVAFGRLLPDKTGEAQNNDSSTMGVFLPARQKVLVFKKDPNPQEAG